MEEEVVEVEAAVGDLDGDGIMNSDDIDDDNDGLIEIHNLDMFNNIRNSLAGTRYTVFITGGPRSATANCRSDSTGDGVFLCGYELMVNLDFAQDSSYASGTVNSTWCPDTENNCSSTTGAGFPGIGAATGNTGGFTGIFEGNGNSISNFYSRNTANTNLANIGLFALNEGGTIRNLAVVEANVFGGTTIDRIGGLVGYNTGTVTASSVTSTGSVEAGVGNGDNVGGLVGNNTGTITASSVTGTGSVEAGGNRNRVGGLVGNNTGTITASFVTSTGSVEAGGGEEDNVGGLVGRNEDTIIGSSASGSVDGGNGTDNRVGGLVGLNENGTIIASSATGSADAGTGINDRVGGLVGFNDGGTIIASYATDSADGGDGNSGNVGGLVGFNDGGTIIASYAMGSADAGTGNNDIVGGLVGRNSGGTIIASYAIGNANGGAANDAVGGLVGWNRDAGTITASYATGVANGGAGTMDAVGSLVGANAATITESYGFSTAINGEEPGIDSSTPLPTIAGVAITSATQLNASGDATTGDAGTSDWWNAASMTGAGAWNFADGQNPALVYSDYDGDGEETYPSCSAANGLFLTIPGTTTQIVCGSTLVGGNSAQGR